MLKKKNIQSGFAIRAKGVTPPSRTFVVLGAPRGGTSLVAGALRLAGVYMGDDTDPANNEDRAFNRHNGDVALLTNGKTRSDYLEEIRKTISARNAAHAVWGWKDPLAALYVDDILPTLVNPHFILVTRDITATVMRERIEASEDMKGEKEHDLYMKKAGQALALYRASLALIEKTSAPTLFVSYEKASRNAEDFAVRLLKFTTGKTSVRPKDRPIIEAITLYGREGAISADLAQRPAPIESLGSTVDLSSFADLPAVYQRCAMLINKRHYDEGLSLAKRVLAQIDLGFDPYPRLQGNPILLAEVEAGMCFMAAVAMINLGDGPGSYVKLGRFSAIARYFSLIQQKSTLIEGMEKQADKLLQNLEQTLRR